MSDIDLPIPEQVVQAIEGYIRKELADAKQYENRVPLDESGIWTLHRLAASIYAKGFHHGCCVEAERQRNAARREADAVRDARETQG